MSYYILEEQVLVGGWRTATGHDVRALRTEPHLVPTWIGQLLKKRVMELLKYRVLVFVDGALQQHGRDGHALRTEPHRHLLLKARVSPVHSTDTQHRLHVLQAPRLTQRPAASC